MAYASSQIKQENITRFCGKKYVQSAKKHISLHQQTRDAVPHWANVVDGGPALAQHRDNVPCLLGIHDILPISKKLK